MTLTRDPSELLPLTPAVLHILLSLSTGEKHGYAMMQEVAVQTNGAVRMGPGTLYGSLKRMLLAGLAEEAEERPDPALDNERRRYYRLTDFGQRVLAAELQRLAQVVQLPAAQQMLGTEGRSG
jgi:DNA-binding PadR family transcriptional regulator